MSLIQKAKLLKSEGYALSFAYLDSRTPSYAKSMKGSTLGYLLSPIDLIPDFIPVQGYLDDLLMLPLLITISIKLIPDEIIVQSREKAKLHIENKKKKAWWFAVIIVLFWLAVLLLVLQEIIQN